MNYNVSQVAQKGKILYYELIVLLPFAYFLLIRRDEL